MGFWEKIFGEDRPKEKRSTLLTSFEPEDRLKVRGYTQELLEEVYRGSNINDVGSKAVITIEELRYLLGEAVAYGWARGQGMELVEKE